MEKIITVNDIRIQVFIDDDENMILTKMAVALHTIKRFMYISNITDTRELKTKDEFIVTKLEDSIRTAHDINSLVNVLYEKWPDVTLVEYCNTWLSLRSDLTGDPFYAFVVYEFLGEKGLSMNSICVKDDYTFFYNTLVSDETKQMENQIAGNILAHKKTKEDVKLIHTEFVKDEEFYSLLVDFDGDLFDIFNNIVLDKNTILATYNDYFKVYENFIPINGWIKSFPDFIVMYSNSMKSYNKFHDVYANNKMEEDKKLEILDELFSKIFIRIKNNKQLVIEFGMKLTSNNLTRDDIQKNIFKALGLFGYKEEKITYMSGIYFIPNIAIDLFILSDMILTDKYVGTYMSIDEMNTIKIINTRAFIYFTIYEGDGITLKTSVKTKIVDRSNTDFNFLYPREMFRKGSYYMKIRLIKVKRIEDIKMFQDVFSRILNYYMDRYEKIVLFYKKYIPNFSYIGIESSQKSESIYDTKTIKDLQVIDPILFGYGYARKCPKNRFPTIVGKYENEEDEGKEEGTKEVFLFPIDNDVKYKYVCKSKEYPWFGVVKNENLKDLLNSQFVPCCFVERQDNRESTNTYKYYYGAIDNEIKDYSKHVFTTNKILPEKRRGYLPVNIQRIMSILDNDNKYMRYGVTSGPSSFLSCVLEVMDSKYYYLETRDEKINYVIGMRKKIADNYPDFNVCKQECYDLNDDDIRNIVKDHNQYLDPRIFIELIKDYFSCDIYLFTRDEKTPGGRIELPRHTNGYFYSNEYRKKVIFIFFHMGSENDVVDYPSCELISNSNINVVYGRDIFEILNSYGDNTSKIFSSIFIESVFKQFTGTRFNLGAIVNKKLKQKFETQYIDKYGKCRGLTMNIKGLSTKTDFIFFTTEPIKPMNIRSVSSNIDVLMNFQYNNTDVIKFINVFSKIEPLEIINIYKNDNNVITEVSFKCKGINISLNTNFISDNFYDVPIKKRDILNLPVSNTSALDNYKYMEKLSRALTETVYYLYSKFINEKPDVPGKLEDKFIVLNYITTILNEKDEKSLEATFDRFKDRYLIIDETFVYPTKHISRNIMDNNFLFTKNKLIINSNKLYNNLKYHLRLRLYTDLMYIFNYHKEKFMRNYYINVEDFKKMDNNIILKGRENVEENFTKMSMRDNIVFSEIRDDILPRYNMSYFFFNKLVGNQPYLVINFKTAKDALLTCVKWYEKFHKTIKNDKVRINPEYIMYKFNNKTSIEEVIVDGEPNNINIKMMRGNIGNVLFYCSILDINDIKLNISQGSISRSKIKTDEDNVKKMFYVPRSNKDCDPDRFKQFIRGPDFHKESCYVDVVLVSLLNRFNEYMNTYFLEKDIENIQLASNKGKLSNFPVLLEIVKNIQINLRDIYTKLQKSGTKYTCNNFRKNMDKYQTTYNSLFYPHTITPLNWINIVDPNNNSLQMEPLDVIARLSEIFSPPDILKQKKYIYVPDNDEYKVAYINGPYLTGPTIVTKFSKEFRMFDKKCVPVDFLMNQFFEYKNFDKDNLFDIDGIKYDQIIERMAYISSPNFLHIHIPRLSSLVSMDEHFCVIPTESIQLGNDEPLILSSVIMRKGNTSGGHYTCFIRCVNGMWLYYDDLDPNDTGKKLYQYNELLSVDIINNITDIIYM